MPYQLQPWYNLYLFIIYLNTFTYNKLNTFFSQTFACQSDVMMISRSYLLLLLLLLLGSYGTLQTTLLDLIT